MNFLQSQQPRLAMLARHSATGRTRILDGTALAARCYATKAPKTTKTKAAPKTKATTPKTTSTGAKTKTTATTTTTPSSVAASTPLRKPSTSGLGVPSKSPSTPAPPPTHSTPTEPSTLAPAVEDASDTAAVREETLRTARLRRIDREREAERQEKAREEYKERYDGAARRYRMFMVGMPILLVTSYYLYQQLVLGNKKELPQLGDLPERRDREKA